MTKVYVSSTFVDLKECREQVKLLLRRLNYEDVAMEYYVSEEQRPIERCLSDVAECDLYIGIFAWRHGWVPPENNPEGYSITEMEYRTAGKHGKHRLIFLLDADALWPRSAMDKNLAQIERLRDELSSNHGRMTFNSADHIASIVAPSVDKWRREHLPSSNHANAISLDVEGYFAALTKRYQRLDLDALTPPQKEEFLQLELSSVFVEQSVREDVPAIELPKEVWEKLERNRDIHADDLPAGITLEDIRRVKESFTEKPTRPVLDVLTDAPCNYSIILGDPGSGKSTLARYLLLSLIRSDNEKLNAAFPNYLPLLIELRHFIGVKADYKECKTFLDFWSHLNETEGYHLDREALHQYLREDGRAVVVFDGLDEIFNPAQREEIARQIVGFSSTYPKVRIVVTSRVIGYRRRILSDAGFTHFTLQDLNKSQVRNFVEQWYSLALHDRPEEVAVRIERITRSFEESSSIRQLAGNPMLLTIMAIIGKNQELPRERWKLYEHAASVLIQHWDVKKHLEDRFHSTHASYIGEEDKKELLRRLAYKMQGGEGGLAGNYIHRDDLQAEFESYLISRYAEQPAKAKEIASVMIDQFRERNFILSSYGAGLHGFIHRAFLEYFCATAIVHRFEKAQEITFEQLKSDLYGVHWKDESWHEVLRLVCGMISTKFAAEIIDYLANDLDRPWPKEFKEVPWNIALAVQCFAEVRNLPEIPETSKNLLEVLCSALDHPAFHSYEIQRGDFFSRQILPYVQEIGKDWPEREVLIQWLLKRKSFKNHWRMVGVFDRFIGSLGEGQEAIHRAVLKYVTHRNVGHRVLAPRALAVGWGGNPQTPALLFQRIESEKNDTVRYYLLSAIGAHYYKHRFTLPLLHRIALDPDEQDWTQVIAIGILGEHFSKHPKTFPLLKRLITQSTNSYVKEHAVRSLSIMKNDARVVRLLKQITPHAEDRLLVVCLDVLLKHSPKDEVAFAVIQQRIPIVSHKYLSFRLMDSMVEHFPDRTETLQFLLRQAKEDSKWEKRLYPLHLLFRHFNNQDTVVSFLRERSRIDPSKRIRNSVKEWLETLTNS